MSLKNRIIIIILLFFIGVMAYISIGLSECSTSQNNAIEIDMPNFVANVWPTPNGKINSICYFISRHYDILRIGQRGINFRVHPAPLITAGLLQQSNTLSFENSVNLYIDGNLVPNTSRIIFDNLVGIETTQEGKNTVLADVSEGYVFSWAPNLWPGRHIARIDIVTTPDKITQYQWSFVIW